MDAATIARLRLYNQQITQPIFRTPAEIVGSLGAIQGQDYPGAKWSIGLRLPGSAEATIDRALADRSVLRTWALRGTLHLVTAEDIRWLLALVAPRVIAGNARRYRQLELDGPTLARGNDILTEALQGGKELDRQSLFAALEERGISTAGQRGVYLLQRASLDGLIAQGAQRGRHETFFALDTLPSGDTLSRDEMLTELARRYFTSRGPATVHDFAWWSGLTMPDVRAGLESVRAGLIAETVEGQTYWRSDLTPAAHDRQTALLPGFDEYLLSYRDRSAALDPAYVSLIQHGGMFTPYIVSGGRVIGTWQRVVRNHVVTITLSSLASPSDELRQAVAGAAQRYGEYLGMPVEMVW